ncbi:hypothetical protein TTHERM_000621059 (macronuclear) [Tetrahymena thermophila SB210]|uniref:Uncharacterized protein n=1 Tax=Tetrahymena thermophila (strain SB210) TaxID=312017 RepID=W7XHN1_TETTS|nr:hypothetical protein TTHERM_000621059 [Tetrahymena thermophila SB210]EWS73921.1 hypothetical protein TTHERM_000621059 [Tetrahymena thermophila SB210]|eukprot:XP_012653543.1 hypothetical protein TTHERM_000621059 [Tetrahymena thermophila SB210]
MIIVSTQYNIDEKKVKHQNGEQNMRQPNNLNELFPIPREHSLNQKTPIVLNVCDQDANYQKQLDQSGEIAKINQQLEKIILEKQQQRIQFQKLVQDQQNQFEKEKLIFKNKIKELKLKNKMLEMESQYLKNQQNNLPNNMNQN